MSKFKELGSTDKVKIMLELSKYGITSPSEIEKMYNDAIENNKPEISEVMYHYDKNTGERNPFYNMSDDTYGTVPLGQVEVTPKYKTPQAKERALNMAAGRRGATYVQKAMHKYATPIGAAIMGGAALGAMGSSGMLSPVINPIDVASVAIDPTDPLNYVSLIRGAGKIGNQLRPSNLRKHVYVNKEPFGYTDFGKTAKGIAKGVLSGKTPDITKVEWETLNNPNVIALDDYGIPGQKVLEARTDAYRKYLKFPQKYDTFTPSKSYIGAYTDVEGIKQLNRLPESAVAGKPTFDFVNSSGGNVGIPNITHLGEVGDRRYGIITTKDTWDLHPFSRNDTKLREKLKSKYNTLIGKKMYKLSSKIDNLGNTLSYDGKAIDEFLKTADEFDLEGFEPSMFPSNSRIRRKLGEGLKKTARFIEDKRYPEFNFLKKAEDRLANLEVGSLIGAEPFTVINEVPFTELKEFDFIENKTKRRAIKGFLDNDNLLTREAYDYMKLNPHLSYDVNK